MTFVTTSRCMNGRQKKAIDSIKLMKAIDNLVFALVLQKKDDNTE